MDNTKFVSRPYPLAKIKLNKMKYHIITFGCQMNKSDSERIASILENTGYQPASRKNGADLIVVNMCSVRQSAVDRVYGLAKKLKNLRAQNLKLKTILTGCILKKDREKFSQKFDLILNLKDLANWPKILKNKKSIIPDSQINKSKDNWWEIEPKYQNNSVAFVPISIGCNFKCTYCVVPFTRGKIQYRGHKEILKEVRRAIFHGFKEIWLVGQIVNNYISPQNHKINFAKLLKKISKLPGDFKIYFTSPHPSFFTEELIETMASSEKIAKYLHLPVQSGDDEILKKMGRTYTSSQYKELVKKVRQKMPNIYLSTDIIVGFPGETKEKFKKTLKLLKEIKFNNAYIAKYSPRPGTVAFQMEDDVPLKEKKRRERILRETISFKNPKKKIKEKV